MTSLAVQPRDFVSPRQSPRGAETPAEAAERSVRAKINQSSKQLVADALIMPILQQFRDTMKQEGLFRTSDAEKRLGPVIDAKVADSIVNRTRLPIVDRVELSLLKRAGLAPNGARQ